VQNINIPNGDLVIDEVEINLDMLHTLILDWVGRQVDDTDIVTGQRGVQLHD
jgi:CYTH domain-containing protein